MSDVIDFAAICAAVGVFAHRDAQTMRTVLLANATASLLVDWRACGPSTPRFTRPQPVTPATTAKPPFPTDNVAQTAAIMAALGPASGPIDAPTIAAGFRQGRRVAPQVSAVLTALTRLGFVTTADAGRTFTLRRVA